MPAVSCVRTAIFCMALVAVSAAVSVQMAQAAPLSEGAPAYSGNVPQSGTCPAGGQQDEQCLPGGLGSPAGSNSTPTPPGTPPVPPPTVPPGTPPAMPPTTLPIAPPSGRPQATRPQDPELPLYIIGYASATLHIHDDDHDVIYTAYHDNPDPGFTFEKVPLTFIRRFEQDRPGTTQYILAGVHDLLAPPAHNLREEDIYKLHVIWEAEGREFDCTVKGKAIVPFPLIPNPRIRGTETYLDPTEDSSNINQPAYGYLNVVGPDGGDFHSVMIKAFSNEPSLIKTCPGDPPLVTKENFQAGFLLHILWQQNTREDGRVSFKGQQTYDMNNPLGLLDMLPPGENRERARQFLNSAETSGTSVRYTWKWELVPIDSAR